MKLCFKTFGKTLWTQQRNRSSFFIPFDITVWNCSVCLYYTADTDMRWKRKFQWNALCIQNCHNVNTRPRKTILYLGLMIFEIIVSFFFTLCAILLHLNIILIQANLEESYPNFSECSSAAHIHIFFISLSLYNFSLRCLWTEAC